MILSCQKTLVLRSYYRLLKVRLYLKSTGFLCESIVIVSHDRHTIPVPHYSSSHITTGTTAASVESSPRSGPDLEWWDIPFLPSNRRRDAKISYDDLDTNLFKLE